MSRDPSRRGWAARRRAVREADRFSALMATNLCLPLPASRNPPSPVASSSAELSCPRWLFILPAALQPRPDGCALVVAAPSLAAPPPSTRRDVCIADQAERGRDARASRHPRRRQRRRLTRTSSHGHRRHRAWPRGRRAHRESRHRAHSGAAGWGCPPCRVSLCRVCRHNRTNKRTNE